MNTTFNYSFFQHVFERGHNESRILLPKWNFPYWIIHQSMESAISFELPLNLPDNFQGIILWVVYVHCFSVVYSADTRNSTSGKKWDHVECYYEKCLGGLSWVSCTKLDFGSFRSGDSIKISMDENNAKVERCGIHLLIGSEGDENVHYFNRKRYGLSTESGNDND